jgi:amino acid transporter
VFGVKGFDHLQDLPALGKLHQRFRTPFVAIIVHSTGVMIFSTMTWQTLVQIGFIFVTVKNLTVVIATVLYASSLLLEFCAFVWLRVSKPHMSR